MAMAIDISHIVQGERDQPRLMTAWPGELTIIYGGFNQRMFTITIGDLIVDSCKSHH
jgi:hypothetical protein